MKTFIAYRFTGEDPKELEPLLKSVKDSFSDRGVDAYCTFFDEASFQEQSFGAGEIMKHAFDEIDKSDFLFVILPPLLLPQNSLLPFLHYPLLKLYPLYNFHSLEK